MFLYRQQLPINVNISQNVCSLASVFLDLQPTLYRYLHKEIIEFYLATSYCYVWNNNDTVAQHNIPTYTYKHLINRPLLLWLGWLVGMYVSDCCTFMYINVLNKLDFILLCVCLLLPIFATMLAPVLQQIMCKVFRCVQRIIICSPLYGRVVVVGWCR